MNMTLLSLSLPESIKRKEKRKVRLSPPNLRKLDKLFFFLISFVELWNYLCDVINIILNSNSKCLFV